jgi:hypothetical protein
VRIDIASAGVLGAFISWGRRHLRPSLFAAASGALMLVGCASDYDKPSSSVQSSKSRVPLPKHALLAPPPESTCLLKTSALNNGQSSAKTAEPAVIIGSLAAHDRFDDISGGSLDWPPAFGAERQPNHMLVQTDPTFSLSQRIRLEYERNCFQQAEIRLRAQLLQLQAAIDKTIRSVKRIEKSAPPKAP